MIEYSPYLMTFSGREIISATSLALLYMAFFSFIGIYGSEVWIEGYTGFFLFFGFVLINILNHILYKKEHKRRNLRFGRFLQLTLTFCIFIMLVITKNFLEDYSLRLPETDSQDVVFGGLAFLIVVSFTEITASAIRRFLVIFKWKTW